MSYYRKVVIESGMRWLALDKDLQLTIIYTLITIDAIYLPIVSQTPVRLALGLGMVLFIPGYALVAALFPGKKDIDSLERVVLSFGLSIAVAPLIGLALNYTPWGLWIDPIVVCLTVLTVACVAIAVKRRDRLDLEERFEVDFGKLLKKLKAMAFPGDKSHLDRVLSVVLVLSVIASIAMLAYVITMPKQGEKFTEFYILGPDGRAETLPDQMSPGEQSPVTVGVVNHEYRPVTYDLVIRLNDSDNARKLYATNFTLQDNQTREETIDILPDRTGQSMQIKFLLYADGNLTVPYRDLHLWVNVTGPASDGEP